MTVGDKVIFKDKQISRQITIGPLDSEVYVFLVQTEIAAKSSEWRIESFPHYAN